MCQSSFLRADAVLSAVSPVVLNPRHAVREVSSNRNARAAGPRTDPPAKRLLRASQEPGHLCPSEAAARFSLR